MRYAIIKDEKVINIVIATKASDINLPIDCIAKVGTLANTGDSYIDGSFIPVVHEYISPEDRELERIAIEAESLSECRKRELKIAMYDLGLNEMFESFRLLEDFDLENNFVFSDPIVKTAMLQIPAETLTAIKVKIIENRT